MAITQLNNYIPGQDVADMGNNVDYNRLGDDKTQMTVSFAGSPATATIKDGSLIEVNGNLYTVTADEPVVMSNATHNYIEFNGTAFRSSATKGTYDATKQGFYNTTYRTLKWFINQDNDYFAVDMTHIGLEKDFQFTGKAAGGHVNAYINTDDAHTGGTSYDFAIPFDTEDHDYFNEFDTGTFRYTPTMNGFYKVDVSLVISDSGGISSVNLYIRKSGTRIYLSRGLSQGSSGHYSLSATIELTTSEYIDINSLITTSGAGITATLLGVTSGIRQCFVSIDKIL